MGHSTLWHPVGLWCMFLRCICSLMGWILALTVSALTPTRACPLHISLPLSVTLYKALPSAPWVSNIHGSKTTQIQGRQKARRVERKKHNQGEARGVTESHTPPGPERLSSGRLFEQGLLIKHRTPGMRVLEEVCDWLCSEGRIRWATHMGTDLGSVSAVKSSVRQFVLPGNELPIPRSVRVITTKKELSILQDRVGLKLLPVLISWFQHFYFNSVPLNAFMLSHVFCKDS